MRPKEVKRGFFQILYVGHFTVEDFYDFPKDGENAGKISFVPHTDNHRTTFYINDIFKNQ
jgi:hypothetical protein